MNTYDGAGDLASSTSPQARKTTYTCDGVGRRLTMVAPNGNVSGGDRRACIAHRWKLSFVYA